MVICVTQYVYRLFDADTRCLYVGATAKIGARLGHHQLRSWGPRIKRIEITTHDSWVDARRTEVDEIRRLAPEQNVNHGVVARLESGELKQWVMDVVREHGPMTQAEIGRRLQESGYAGGVRDFASVLRRLFNSGELVVAAERKPLRGPQGRRTRVYDLRADIVLT
jgi:hypothetical protein